MEWKYVKPLESIKLIEDFECMTKYVFGDSFKKCVLNYNGGKPTLEIFDTETSKERAIKALLSFNHKDRETVWKIFEWNKEDLVNQYIPFGIDNFGNLICFDANNDHIVFLNHEDKHIEFVASNFDDFLNLLK